MTFMEALNSGRPMRRSGHVYWWLLCTDGDGFGYGYWSEGREAAAMREVPTPPEFSRDDYNATDWEVSQ